MSIFIKQDGSVEAWDGDNYVPFGQNFTSLEHKFEYRPASKENVMATKNTNSAPTEAIQVAVSSPQQIVNEGIALVIAATGIDVQKNRYKAMRAIAWEAFARAIQAKTFDQLVTAAIKNIDKLPAGWEIETAAKPPVKASPAKATATKSRRAA